MSWQVPSNPCLSGHNLRKRSFTFTGRQLNLSSTTLGKLAAVFRAKWHTGPEHQTGSGQKTRVRKTQTRKSRTENAGGRKRTDHPGAIPTAKKTLKRTGGYEPDTQVIEAIKALSENVPTDKQEILSRNQGVSTCFFDALFATPVGRGRITCLVMSPPAQWPGLHRPACGRANRSG